MTEVSLVIMLHKWKYIIRTWVQYLCTKEAKWHEDYDMRLVQSNVSLSEMWVFLFIFALVSMLLWNIPLLGRVASCLQQMERLFESEKGGLRWDKK